MFGNCSALCFGMILGFSGSRFDKLTLFGLFGRGAEVFVKVHGWSHTLVTPPHPSHQKQDFSQIMVNAKIFHVYKEIIFLLANSAIPSTNHGNHRVLVKMFHQLKS